MSGTGRPGPLFLLFSSNFGSKIGVLKTTFSLLLTNKINIIAFKHLKYTKNFIEHLKKQGFFLKLSQKFSKNDNILENIVERNICWRQQK